MKTFMDEDFLLMNETAKSLFHQHAEQMPIYDYHNHLSPKDIAERRKFHNLYELWLETDHYKWRAMRANGVDEEYITGKAEPYEKYLKWAEITPELIGSPLYHWMHLELQRYFGINEVLSLDTAEAIWQKTEKILQEDYDCVSLLEKVQVKVLCTTDDPIDSLQYHQQIRKDDSIPFRVYPSFRPDKYLDVYNKDWKANCDALCQKYHTDDLKKALELSLDFFVENGCRVADHGFGEFLYDDPQFRELMLHLGKLYAERNVVMQLHLSPIRNNSAKLFASFGPDAGGDSIGKQVDIIQLNRFLKELEASDALPKTILYNLNPADNEALATTANNFGARVQYGPAWWFNDTKRGIEKQLTSLMETSALTKSAGMLTDSRSFTSFVRHEYFRRILCNMLGELVESGQYPNNTKTLGRIVENICYNNAVHFFER